MMISRIAFLSCNYSSCRLKQIQAPESKADKHNCRSVVWHAQMGPRKHEPSKIKCKPVIASCCHSCINYCK